jgi:adenine-specific DNA-methyltransferase
LCTKTKGLESLETIIKSIDCPKFLISYSEDGLFTLAQLEDLFSKYGKVNTEVIDYNRFRSNDSPLPKKLKEYLISIERK